MPRLSRRTFVGWLWSLGAALGFRNRAQALELSGALAGDAGAQASALNPVLVLALAEAVLPSELGAGGVASASRGFMKWLVELRPGAELLHGYGTSAIVHAASSPVQRWETQLRALDQAARESHHAAFAQLSIPQRQEIVRSAIAGEKLSGMPASQSAVHVALGLLAWYYDTPAATDLCYRARIGKNQCRPLVHSSREPLPLAPNAKGAGA